MWKKVLITLLVIVVVIIAGFTGFVQFTYNKDYSESHPVPELEVEYTSEMIARGRYLANGPAHCSHCHAPMEAMDRVEAGEEVPLTGGFGLDIPPGKFNAPNITPDPETGIGSLSDGELYRMFRYNINHKGEACIDFMPFVNMSDEDIYSIIAYLRSLEPVKAESEPVKYTFLGKMVKAMGAIKPGVPDDGIPYTVKKEPTVKYGQYLAYAVANCRGCHTERDINTGEYIGEDYAGGLYFGPDNMTAGFTFIAPNLTPDPETGHIYDWDLETFMRRMQKGRLHETSPMPWGAFTQMDSIDIVAIYKYLQSLDPVQNEVPETAIPPESSASFFQN